MKRQAPPAARCPNEKLEKQRVDCRRCVSRVLILSTSSLLQSSLKRRTRTQTCSALHHPRARRTRLRRAEQSRCVLSRRSPPARRRSWCRCRCCQRWCPPPAATSWSNPRLPRLRQLLLHRLPRPAKLGLIPGFPRHRCAKRGSARARCKGRRRLPCQTCGVDPNQAPLRYLDARTPCRPRARTAIGRRRALTGVRQRFERVDRGQPLVLRTGGGRCGDRTALQRSRLTQLRLSSSSGIDSELSSSKDGGTRHQAQDRRRKRRRRRSRRRSESCGE